MIARNRKTKSTKSSCNENIIMKYRITMHLTGLGPVFAECHFPPVHCYVISSKDKYIYEKLLNIHWRNTTRIELVARYNSFVWTR